MHERNKIKVLVIRFSSMGDIVLTTPVLRCLKKIPGKQVEVHFITKKMFTSLLFSNPYVDKLFLLDGKLSDLTGQLKKEDYDYIVDLHHNLRSLIVKLHLRKPSGNCRKLNLEKWLKTRLKIDRLPDIHVVDRYFEAAAVAGTENDGQGLDFFFPPGLEVMPPGLPGFVHGDYLAFVIGGKHPTKRLPNEKIISLCEKLPLPVLLLGGAEDASNGRAIAAACGENVFNACGLFSLPQSAYLVKRSLVVISHDTGLMHIAAVFNKHLISVWGNTVPAFGMVPYMPAHPERSTIVEVEGLSCRPCTKIGYAKCPKGHFDCMNKIDEDLIVWKVWAIMANDCR
ncbi:MAG: glycosyltransferase family 9 protein [Bacteroidales bacterium]